MTAKHTRIALVCLTPREEVEGAPYESPSYGIRRIHAAVLAAPELARTSTELFDSQDPDADAYVARIEAFDPDVVGFSVFVWSFPFLVEVARRLKANRADRTIVFGGPSARPAMFSLPPFADSLAFVDAIVIREGEEAFCDIAALPDRRPDALRAVRGIAVPSPGGWVETEPRPLLEPLDRIASPYQMGLMPKRHFGYLETYRGCPLSCLFCEWGISGGARRVFSKEYLVRELRALADAECVGAFNLDAGLNLNVHAFRNLRDAEAEVGFFRQSSLVCEVYPSHLGNDVLEFLRTCNTSYIGVGLQSFNKEALDGLDRPFREERFEPIVQELAQIGPVEIQMILGLPGDDPRSFRATFERARRLPAQVRVYHCLVLPDALMTRSPREFELEFDPYTLKMTSCKGWPAGAIDEERARLVELAAGEGRASGDLWVSFDRPGDVSYHHASGGAPGNQG